MDVKKFANIIIFSAIVALLAGGFMAFKGNQDYKEGAGDHLYAYVQKLSKFDREMYGEVSDYQDRVNRESGYYEKKESALHLIQSGKYAMMGAGVFLFLGVALRLSARPSA